MRPSQRFSGSRRERLGAGSASLLVGTRQHDQPVHRLDRPARLNEAAGQPVEERRVGRPFPSLAKVVGAANQSLAEMVLPDPIDHHPCHERIVSLRQPIRQLLPAAPLVDAQGRSALADQDLRNPARNGLARSLPVATHEDLGILESLMPGPFRPAVLHDNGLRNLARLALLEQVELLAQTLQPRACFSRQRSGALLIAQPERPARERSSSSSSSSGSLGGAFASAGSSHLARSSLSTTPRSASSSCRS